MTVQMILVTCQQTRSFEPISKSYGGQQPIAVYRITDFPFRRELIAVQSLPADQKGWFEFDITVATRKWVGMAE